MEYRVVLSPIVSVVFDIDYSCEVCKSHSYFQVNDTKLCTTCEFNRKKKDGMVIEGWSVMRTAHSVICRRLG